MADPWDTGAHLSLILSHANKTWHKTGENMPQWICTFICFSSVSPVLSFFLVPGDVSPKVALKDPHSSRRTRQGVKLPGFCRTHKHPECRSHSLPDVLRMSCSNKAAATSSQTTGKHHSPQKSSHLETHFH